jgi:Fe-S cluster biosynthesis and repair protein YggX
MRKRKNVAKNVIRLSEMDEEGPGSLRQKKKLNSSKTALSTMKASWPAKPFKKKAEPTTIKKRSKLASGSSPKISDIKKSSKKFDTLQQQIRMAPVDWIAEIKRNSIFQSLDKILKVKKPDGGKRAIGICKTDGFASPKEQRNFTLFEENQQLKTKMRLKICEKPTVDKPTLRSRSPQTRKTNQSTDNLKSAKNKRNCVGSGKLKRAVLMGGETRSPESNAVVHVKLVKTGNRSPDPTRGKTLHNGDVRDSKLDHLKKLLNHNWDGRTKSRKIRKKRDNIGTLGDSVRNSVDKTEVTQHQLQAKKNQPKVENINYTNSEKKRISSETFSRSSEETLDIRRKIGPRPKLIPNMSDIRLLEVSRKIKNLKPKLFSINQKKAESRTDAAALLIQKNVRGWLTRRHLIAEFMEIIERQRSEDQQLSNRSKSKKPVQDRNLWEPQKQTSSGNKRILNHSLRSGRQRGLIEEASLSSQVVHSQHSNLNSQREENPAKKQQVSVKSSKTFNAGIEVQSNSPKKVKIKDGLPAGVPEPILARSDFKDSFEIDSKKTNQISSRVISQCIEERDRTLKEPVNGNRGNNAENSGKGVWNQFAKEEYAKWGKVASLIHNIEDKLGNKAAEEVQQLFKQLEIFAETSKKNLKEVFQVNDSYLSNHLSEGRSSRHDLHSKAEFFERKVALRGNPRSSIRESENVEENVKDHGSSRDHQSENPSEGLLKKAKIKKLFSKDTLEKWVDLNEGELMKSVRSVSCMEKFKGVM